MACLAGVETQLHSTRLDYGVFDFSNIHPAAAAASKSPKNSRVSSTQGVSAFIVSTMDGMPLASQSIKAGTKVAAQTNAANKDSHNNGRMGFCKASRPAFKQILPYSNIHDIGSGSLYCTSTNRKKINASAQ